MQSLSMNGPYDQKSYGKMVNSDKFCHADNSALWIIRPVCLYSDGDELGIVDCTDPTVSHN